MKKRVVIDKPVGETPLMAIQEWKKKNPAYRDIRASYAGRLDPMASGKLLVLLGEECRRQQAYTDLDKEYEVEVLFDVKSDTGDALGIVEYSGKETKVGREAVLDALRSEQGTHTRPYPKFSSKTVGGKPLFLYALENTIEQVSIPEHEETIYKIKVRNIHQITSGQLASRIEHFLSRAPTTREPSKSLGADFRIDVVRASWNKLIEEAGARSFTVLSIRVACGSGTYMRSLAERIGRSLGTGAIALSIHRTKIGKYWRGFGVRSKF